MLDKQRCPHTGIVNYFSKSEPFFSVGSIIATDRQQGRVSNLRSGEFHWRVYDAVRTISGIAGDMEAAERALQDEYRCHKRSAN